MTVTRAIQPSRRFRIQLWPLAVLGCPEFKTSATLVKSQRARLSPASWVFLPLLCLYLVACNYLNGVPVN